MCYYLQCFPFYVLMVAKGYLMYSSYKHYLYLLPACVLSASLWFTMYWQLHLCYWQCVCGGCVHMFAIEVF